MTYGLNRWVLIVRRHICRNFQLVSISFSNVFFAPSSGLEEEGTAA